MMKVFAKTGVLALMLLLAAGTAQAQKFGYVNSAALLADLPETKQMRSTLEGLQAVLQKEGEAKVTAFQTKVQTAEQKKQRGEMTPKEEETVMAELQKEQDALVQLEQEIGQKMQTKQADLMQPIVDKVNKAIQDVAKENGFQFIFDAQSGVILYAEESADVTALVKTKLNI